MSSTPQLEDGFTMLANELMERVLGFGFSHREQSVIFTIFRKTYGYGKKEDDMSASQIGTMCGITRQHVTTTLNLLALRNVINKRPGRFGTIVGIQKDHRRWITSEQMKSLPDSPDLGRAAPREEDKSMGSIVPNQDTRPELGLVPNKDAPSPESGQVDSPESGHTKENLPKENHQKKTSCASQAKREPKPAPNPGTLQDRFARFYAAYPKKKARGAAEKVFLKLRPDEHLLTAMIAGIERAMKSEQWTDPKFIPNPATWLGRMDWLDEIRTEYTAAEQAVIQAFNDALGEQLGHVAKTPFVESRAAAIRDFATFSDKPGFVVRFFPWVSKNTTLPPSVGFDFIISRKGYGNITSGQHARKEN